MKWPSTPRTGSYLTFFDNIHACEILVPVARGTIHSFFLFFFILDEEIARKEKKGKEKTGNERGLLF